jgi:hypothetical protein
MSCIPWWHTHDDPPLNSSTFLHKPSDPPVAHAVNALLDLAMLQASHALEGIITELVSAMLPGFGKVELHGVASK